MSNNAGTIVIQLILSKIADKDIDAVSSNLARLPLGVISSTQSDTLLSWFLNKAAEHHNTDAARTIVSAFDMARIRVDPLPAITQLFLNTSLSRDTLLFTLNCFPEKQPLDYFIDLVNMSGDLLALKAAALIITAFPTISSTDWALLLSLTDRDPESEPEEEDAYPNQMLRVFLQAKVAETGVCTKRPEWVQDFSIEDIPHVPDTIPSVKEGVELLLEAIEKQQINIISGVDGESVDVRQSNEVKETLISQYAISTIAEKIQMLFPVKEMEPFDDTIIFREFGPLNTMYTISAEPPDPAHECSKHGGCRMFTCTEFEQMYADGDAIDIMAIEEQTDNIDWFRKSCDKCLKPINHRHFAIRQPLCHGGWMGCFCSIDCMKEGVTDPHIALMIGRMQEQLSVIGIRHR